MINIEAIVERIPSEMDDETQKQSEFSEKYTWQQRFCHILSICVDWLEKDRQYTLACLVLSDLLLKFSNLSDSRKRGDWWVRLCVDLKHLKLRKECVKVAQYALLYDQGSVKSGNKNTLLKMYE